MDNSKEKVEKSWMREMMEWVVCIGIALIVAVIIRYFVFTPTLVKQTSMTPTIQDGERVIINRLVRTFNLSLHRGDIITFEEPDYVDYDLAEAKYYDRTNLWDNFTHNFLEIGKRSFIKRIIGLPGDEILIEDGAVYVNGRRTAEVYLNGIQTPRKGEFYDLTVPEGHIFVMGDNRSGSTDSRALGCIPLDKVEGRVVYRFWPLSRFGKIDS